MLSSPQHVTDWTPEDLWHAYIQLTEAEAAFRIEKSDLRIRPIWHQREDRVLAHILVCFLAYVLWRTLRQMTQAAGLGDEPRRVLQELNRIRIVDVVLPTRSDIEIRRRCVTRPTQHLTILLPRLELKLPNRIFHELDVVKTSELRPRKKRDSVPLTVEVGLAARFLCAHCRFASENLDGRGLGPPVFRNRTGDPFFVGISEMSELRFWQMC